MPLVCLVWEASRFSIFDEGFYLSNRKLQLRKGSVYRGLFVGISTLLRSHEKPSCGQFNISSDRGDRYADSEWCCCGCWDDNTLGHMAHEFEWRHST